MNTIPFGNGVDDKKVMVYLLKGLSKHDKLSGQIKYVFPNSKVVLKKVVK